ncbi:MAG: Uma2 family endonuclease [Cyclobacteriaceae bacterium]|nr:Uma2 family endonuclease [Cyclobacteriaceae bacterium]
METTIERPPRTMMEVYELLPEGTLAELIDNQIYMSPAPLFKHQKTIQSIFKELDKLVDEKEKGTVIVAPYDIKLDKSKNSVQPDIIVILKSNQNQINELGRFEGVPDLLVEVLSPSNKEYDLIRKKDLYEKFGVKEYWVVDPETKLAIGFEWRESGYAKINEEIGTIRSCLLKENFAF